MRGNGCGLWWSKSWYRKVFWTAAAWIVGGDFLLLFPITSTITRAITSAIIMRINQGQHSHEPLEVHSDDPLALGQLTVDYSTARGGRRVARPRAKL